MKSGARQRSIRAGRPTSNGCVERPAADDPRGNAAFQRFNDALAGHFRREQILEIVGVVVNMSVWTRIKLAEGAMPGPVD